MLTRSRVTALVLAVLVSVGGLSACSSDSDPASAGGAGSAVTDVSPADAVTLLTEPGITVIDVRTPGEYSTGHLADAVNIDIEGTTFDQQLADLPKADTYFVYCRSGNRSGVATAQMATLGFTSVYNLQGGVVDWQASGGALVTD